LQRDKREEIDSNIMTEREVKAFRRMKRVLNTLIIAYMTERAKEQELSVKAVNQVVEMNSSK
jgi:hypothetical protein